MPSDGREEGDVRLELRRIGGITGALNLLRSPCRGGAGHTTFDGGIFAAQRVELGAALLACGISDAERSGSNFFKGDQYSRKPT